MEDGPASTIKGMRPSSSSRTCAAVVGLIRPNRLALGAAERSPKGPDDFSENWMRTDANGNVFPGRR